MKVYTILTQNLGENSFVGMSTNIHTAKNKFLYALNELISADGGWVEEALSNIASDGYNYSIKISDNFPEFTTCKEVKEPEANAVEPFLYWQLSDNSSGKLVKLSIYATELED